jgi:membrane-associated phospholipid phosphatase
VDRAITRRNTFLLLALAAYLILSYGLTNHYPVRVPRRLPSFAVESTVSLIPWTCWVYLSYFALLVVSGLRLRSGRDAMRSMGAIAFVITVSGVIFLLVPTTIDRPPLAGEGVSVNVLRWLRGIDPPNNCFPSLHVAMACVCSLLVIRTDRRRGLPLLPWTILISISTLTTKQHYLLDVMGGAVLAVLGLSVFFWIPSALARRS